jgi:glycosyltransferase involved in cell wall biosynthesis
VDISVIIPTHNPHLGRLRSTLEGLKRQNMAPGRWETLLIDNSSSVFPDPEAYSDVAPENLSLMHEGHLGLTSARICGFRAAKGAIVVMADDDNVLDPGYLTEVARIFGREGKLGAAGGKSTPVYETAPVGWQLEFTSLLAVRDLGPLELMAKSFRPDGTGTNQYPACAPIGAGMALRRECAVSWAEGIANDNLRRRLDRTGAALVSGGDNDIIMTLLEQGWSVGYFPTLGIQHLIPSGRLEAGYLSRLNRAIQRSWVQALALHGANRWTPIAPWTLGARKAKAYFKFQAWKSPAHRIRWQGMCGQYEGRASIRE